MKARFSSLPLHTCGKSPQYQYLMGGWVDPKSGLGTMEKIKILHSYQ
jgi:hypothetical protein